MALITVDNGTLTDYDVANDDLGGATGRVQYNKLMDGTVGGTQVVQAGEQGLFTIPRRPLTRIPVTSGGLTTATTAYTAGDQVGTQFTFANAARLSGGSGTVVGCVMISAADITGAYDLVLFDSSVTLASDNAAFAISDADALKLVGLLQLSGAYDIGNNRIAQIYNVAMPYVCSGGTSLFGGLITRSGHTFFAATTDLQVNLYVEPN